MNGNPTTLPGSSPIYDVCGDCRKPVMQSLAPVARLGTRAGLRGRPHPRDQHRVQSITAIDVDRPEEPQAVWQGQVVSHGMTLRDDGNRASSRTRAATC